MSGLRATREKLRYLRDKVRWIASRWEGRAGWIPVLVFMTFLSTAVTVAYPRVFGHVLEKIRGLESVGSVAADIDAEVQTMVWILLAIGFARLLAGFYPAFRALLNSKIELATREAFFAVVLRKGHRFFNMFRTGDVVTRLTDDIAGYPKIAWFCCSGLFRALDSTSRIVFCLAVMLYLDVSLALYSLIPVPFMVGLFLFMEKRLARAVKDQRAAASATSDFLEASFSGVSIVQAMTAEGRLGDALARQLAGRLKAEVRLAHLWVIFSIFLFQALNVVGQLVVVVVGGLRVLDGTLSLGDFFSFYLYLSLLLPPMMDLPNLFVTARQAFVCMERLDELEAFDPEGGFDAGRGEEALDAIRELQIEGVSFTYPRDLKADAKEPASSGLAALSEVDLTVAAGERVAVVGEIGAGKTTVVRLLAGILTPGAGAVRVNGRDQSELHGPSLRRELGYVSQDPVLFTASIRENILLGREEDPARLARSLELSGLQEEVDGLSDGLDHELGLRGSGLSGGQRQRLTIARALYGDPSFLLLDDITAALDAENEERFWERVFEEWPDVTVLVVTHRAATARRMQRTVTLREGAVAG